MKAKELETARNIARAQQLRFVSNQERNVFADLMFYKDSVQQLNRAYIEHSYEPQPVSGDILSEYVNS